MITCSRGSHAIECSKESRRISLAATCPRNSGPPDDKYTKIPRPAPHHLYFLHPRHLDAFASCLVADFCAPHPCPPSAQHPPSNPPPHPILPISPLDLEKLVDIHYLQHMKIGRSWAMFLASHHADTFDIYHQSWEWGKCNEQLRNCREEYSSTKVRLKVILLSTTITLASSRSHRTGRSCGPLVMVGEARATKANTLQPVTINPSAHSGRLAFSVHVHSSEKTQVIQHLTSSTQLHKVDAPNRRIRSLCI